MPISVLWGWYEFKSLVIYKCNDIHDEAQVHLAVHFVESYRGEVIRYEISAGTALPWPKEQTQKKPTTVLLWVFSSRDQITQWHNHPILSNGSIICPWSLFGYCRILCEPPKSHNIRNTLKWNNYSRGTIMPTLFELGKVWPIISFAKKAWLTRWLGVHRVAKKIPWFEMCVYCWK